MKRFFVYLPVILTLLVALGFGQLSAETTNTLSIVKAPSFGENVTLSFDNKSIQWTGTAQYVKIYLEKITPGGSGVLAKTLTGFYAVANPSASTVSTYSFILSDPSLSVGDYRYVVESLSDPSVKALSPIFHLVEKNSIGNGYIAFEGNYPNYDGQPANKSIGETVTVRFKVKNLLIDPGYFRITLNKGGVPVNNVQAVDIPYTTTYPNYDVQVHTWTIPTGTLIGNDYSFTVTSILHPELKAETNRFSVFAAQPEITNPDGPQSLNMTFSKTSVTPGESVDIKAIASNNVTGLKLEVFRPGSAFASIFDVPPGSYGTNNKIVWTAENANQKSLLFPFNISKYFSNIGGIYTFKLSTIPALTTVNPATVSKVITYQATEKIMINADQFSQLKVGQYNHITFSHYFPSAKRNVFVYKGGVLLSGFPVLVQSATEYDLYVPDSWVTGNDYVFKIVSTGNQAVSASQPFSIGYKNIDPEYELKVDVGDSKVVGINPLNMHVDIGARYCTVSFELLDSNNNLIKVFEGGYKDQQKCQEFNSTSVLSRDYQLILDQGILAGNYIVRIKGSYLDYHSNPVQNKESILLIPIIKTDSQNEVGKSLTISLSGTEINAEQDILASIKAEGPVKRYSVKLYKGDALVKIISNDFDLSSQHSNYVSVWDLKRYFLDPVYVFANVTPGEYTIRVVDLDTPTISDEKKFIFSNTLKNISLTNTPSEYQRNNEYVISWNTSGDIGKVKLQLLKGGVPVSGIPESIFDTGITYYRWMVPNSIAGGTDYAIKVSSVTYPNVYAIKENIIIANPTSLNTLATPIVTFIADSNLGSHPYDPKSLGFSVQPASSTKYLTVALYKDGTFIKNIYAGDLSTASGIGKKITLAVQVNDLQTNNFGVYEIRSWDQVYQSANINFGSKTFSYTKTEYPNDKISIYKQPPASISVGQTITIQAYDPSQQPNHQVLEAVLMKDGKPLEYVKPVETIISAPGIIQFKIPYGFPVGSGYSFYVTKPLDSNQILSRNSQFALTNSFSIYRNGPALYVKQLLAPSCCSYAINPGRYVALSFTSNSYFVKVKLLRYGVPVANHQMLVAPTEGIVSNISLPIGKEVLTGPGYSIRVEDYFNPSIYSQSPVFSINSASVYKNLSASASMSELHRGDSIKIHVSGSSFLFGVGLYNADSLWKISTPLDPYVSKLNGTFPDDPEDPGGQYDLVLPPTVFSAYAPSGNYVLIVTDSNNIGVRAMAAFKFVSDILYGSIPSVSFSSTTATTTLPITTTNTTPTTIQMPTPPVVPTTITPAPTTTPTPVTPITTTNTTTTNTATPIATPTTTNTEVQADFTINGAHQVTVSPGASFTFGWSSKNANQFSTKFVSTPATCGSGTTVSFGVTANGSATRSYDPGIVNYVRGCTVTYTFTAKNTSTGQSKSTSAILIYK